MKRIVPFDIDDRKEYQNRRGNIERWKREGVLPDDMDIKRFKALYQEQGINK